MGTAHLRLSLINKVERVGKGTAMRGMERCVILLL